MTAKPRLGHQILAKLASRGITLELAGENRIIAKPTSAISERLKAYLKVCTGQGPSVAAVVRLPR